MKKKHIKVFTEINASIPKELTSRLMKKVNKYEKVKEILQYAINDPEYPEWKREVYTNMITAGKLDEEMEVEDDEIQAQIYKYIQDEIIKKVDEGVLPKYMLKELTKTSKEVRNKNK